jgi:MFS family permease
MSNNIVSSKSFIQRDYIVLKLHYFLSHSSLSSFSPVLDMILDHRGLSFLEISYINLLIPFLVFFTNPLFGYIADHTRRFRLIFNITFGLGTILFVIMFFFPSIKNSHIRGELHENKTMEYSMIFCANEEFARKCTLRSKCGCI